MTVNRGASTDSRPAVYNERNTGVTVSDASQLSALRMTKESRPVLSQQAEGEQASDTFLNSITQANPLQSDTPLRIGRVLLAMPYIHCYKIQISGRQGTCIATATNSHSNMPLGVRSGEVIPPNSTVLVWKPKTSTLAYIIAVLPTPTMDDKFNASDHIQQGGNSGVKKVEAYRLIPKATANAMGWVAQSSGRPIDGTIGEYVRMSETGIGLMIDSFQAYLRVNEVCGLWLNYFDNYAKLAALSLNIMSYCEHNIQTYDEGELFSMRGYVTYPWEATGMYADGIKFSESHGKEKVQLDKQFPFAEEDIENPAQTPIYRLTDTWGYLGQGFNRTLMKPAKESGKRLMTDEDKDTGLFQELLALDGQYSVRSAKGITFAKYPLIPNPRRVRSVDDAKGDDYTEDSDYKFSGKFGEGDEHKVKDWNDEDVTQNKSLLRVAGIQDMLAHHFNWKSTHPYAYHTKDYKFPEESEGDKLNYVDFYRGSMEKAYIEVFPKTTLKIDDRYGDVNYYNTASFFSLTEDGSVVIGDGYGAQITMSGGQIRLEAGGDIMLMSGSRVVTLAKESIIRTKGSIDISSSDGDVRIKSENNMQLLAANSGNGGLLLESKGQGTDQDYEQKLGEDVKASGIVLLSRGGSVSTITKDIYLRSGVDEGNAESLGDIIIDCANGRSNTLFYARSHAFFNKEGLGIWHSPTGQDEVTIDKSHFFGPTFAKINGPTVMSKSVVICDGGSLGVDNGVFARGHIMAVGAMACKNGVGGLGDSSKDNVPEEINNFISESCEIAKNYTEFGEPFFSSYFTDLIWDVKKPGNTDLLNNQIGFSFRDKSSQSEEVYSYEAEGFFLMEARWQQLQRVGLVPGFGDRWSETAVSYQGNDLYPWPGKRNWIDEDRLLQYTADGGFLLYDTAGHAKSREESRSDYEEPKFKDWVKKSCNSDFLL